MTRRSDSGSSRSPSAVEPLTSVNTSVTTLRTSRAGGPASGSGDGAREAELRALRVLLAAGGAALHGRSLGRPARHAYTRVVDAERVRRAASFESVAEIYERARPDYPADAVEWLVGDARRVLDLAAGTGKLTRGLAADGRELVAVEPSEAMLAELRRAVPGARALVGTRRGDPAAGLLAWTPSRWPRPSTGSIPSRPSARSAACSARAACWRWSGTPATSASRGCSA